MLCLSGERKQSGIGERKKGDPSPFCQPKTNPIPQASTKAAPPPEETAQSITTNEDQQDALSIKKKKKGTQGLQLHGSTSPLTIKRSGLNVP